MAITALAQHIKTLADGTVRLLLRLEGEEVGEPTVLSCSMYERDLVLVEKVERAPETAKIPAVIELSPSLLAPAV